MRELISRYVYFPLTQYLKGHRVLHYLREMKERERWDTERLQSYQRKCLQEHLNNAAKSPFYAEKFRRCGFDPHMDIDDFSQLPLTTKSEVRASPQALNNPEYHGKRVEGRTSGTTGISLPVSYNSQWDQRNQAAQLRGRSWWNIHPGSRELDIWGRAFDSKQAEWIAKLKLSLLNRKMISCFQLNDQQLDDLMPELIKFNPEVIYSYTTGVGRLAEYLWEKYGDSNPLKPRVAIITSEILLEPHRIAINAAFGSEPVNEYGAVEAGIIAFECPARKWHIFADNLILEIVDADDKGVGKVVVTPLLNLSMPLVRYDLGDVGRIIEGKCDCGRTLPLFELSQGRISDVIETPRGKQASTDFFDFMAKSLIPQGLRQFRVIQKSLTHLHIQMVHSRSEDPTTEKMVRNQVKQYLGDDIEITFEYLKELRPEKSGKLRYFIKEDF